MRLSDLGRRPRAVAAAAVSLGLAVSAFGCTDDRDEPPDPAGEVIGDGDTYEATIRRTDGNVPHITGDTMADVAFGQGFASGQDRACDLADQVIKIRGERARWFGPGEGEVHLTSDFAWRGIGIFERASDDWEEVSPEVEELITAFTDGWNAHLEEVGRDGLSGWCAGAEWVRPIEPVEVYAYARSIALQASSAAIAPFIATARPPGAPPDEVTDNAPEPDSDASGTTTATGGREVTAPQNPAGQASDLSAGETAAGAAPILPPERIASNGWAIGADRSASGGGMLLANPHFPWEGELRFWEVHLTVPGVLDIYGAQLSGLPGIGIGFTDSFAWTHTVSAGNRFTAYRLQLVPGDPTSYRYGSETREMTSTDVTVEVLDDDGSIDEVTRTMWSTHYGPVIDFPGIGWSDSVTLTYRDANIDNDEFLDQYIGMLRAGDLDEFIQVHERIGGVPLFNTIAASRDGRAWYADTSATPNLSDHALEAYEEAVATDPIVALAADNGAVLLDGSDPLFEWAEADGARDPGLVPLDDLPQIQRDDYVFNANDSFWLPHAEATIEGDYSLLHGRQRTARSPRTRENATLLASTAPSGPAGEDGAFTLDELAAASLANRGYTSRALREDVVARCTGAAPVRLPALVDDEGNETLSAAEVDVGPACAVLADWDGTYDLDSVGPVLWREMMHRFEGSALTEAGPLWAEPFDPERPVATPSGLAAAPPGGPDPVLEALARAVQILESAGVPLDAPLGDVQFALRGGEQIPIHGGDNADGTTNIVGFGSSASILDPALAVDRERVAPGAALSRYRLAPASPGAPSAGGETAGDTGGNGGTTTSGDPAGDGEATGEALGYLVNNGTSFLLAVDLGADVPRAKVFLTYGNTEDRSDGSYADATRRFSAKDWRDVAFTEDDIAAATTSTITVRG